MPSETGNLRLKPSPSPAPFRVQENQCPECRIGIHTFHADSDSGKIRHDFGMDKLLSRARPDNQYFRIVNRFDVGQQVFRSQIGQGSALRQADRILMYKHGFMETLPRQPDSARTAFIFRKLSVYRIFFKQHFFTPSPHHLHRKGCKIRQIHVGLADFI